MLTGENRSPLEINLTKCHFTRIHHESHMVWLEIKPSRECVGPRISAQVT